MARHDSLAALDPLDATADLVLAAAQRWRMHKDHWTDADRRLENRLWLELLDLYDARRRPSASHDDVLHASVRLLAVARLHEDLLSEVSALRTAVWALQSEVFAAA